MSDEDEYEVLSPNAGLGVRQRHVFFPGEPPARFLSSDPLHVFF